MLKVFLHIVLVLSLILVLLRLVGCAKSSNNPAGSANHVWKVSGRTYYVGSTTKVSGVLLTCAGMTVTSGADGTFEFRDVPGGSQTITAQRSGCDFYSQSLDVNSDLTCYVYLNLRAMSLGGHITNAVDGPVQGAKVTFGGLVSYTDTSGRYQFSNLFRGTYTFSVTHPIYLSYQASFFLISDTVSDVVLKREVSLDGKIKQDTYVDETSPSTNFSNSTQLYLSQRAYDSSAHVNVSAIRNIYISFSFPDLLLDARYSVVDASLQLFRWDDGPSISFNTYAVSEPWSAGSLTFLQQPLQGPNLYTGSFSGIGYKTVLGLNALVQLLTEWRAKRPFYGIVIKGGDYPPAKFDSMEFYSLFPFVTFKVRY
jgi:hypothetical protein